MADEKSTAPGADILDDPEAHPAVVEKHTALEAEVAEHKDRLLRTLAEMENLRRRTEREMADTRQYAVASFAREMLIVADNLKRAIEAVPADARAADPALSNLMDGVEATERGLEQTLTRFGVKPVDAKGKKFDPAFHQAMYEVESPDVPPGHVVDVMQNGYAIGERVLRPAMVSIAKAPAGAPASAANDDGKPVAS